MNTKPPSRHERRRQLTCRQLQKAAVALVLEKGYDTVTIQDITDRADLGRGTFYIHFRDKEDVVWSAIEAEMRVTEEEAHSQFPDGLPPRIEYYGYLNILRHAEKNADLYRVMLGAQGSAQLTARVVAHLSAEYARDLSQTKVQLYEGFDAPREILIQVVAGAVIQTVSWWLETPNIYTADQMAKYLYETLHHQQAPE